MVSVVLYDEESIVRIAQRAVECFEGYRGYRTTRDTIWLKGMYLKFTPRLLILNVFNAESLSENEIAGCLKRLLLGEEVYVSDNCQFQKYIDKVNSSTDFDISICGDCL